MKRIVILLLPLFAACGSPDRNGNGNGDDGGDDQPAQTSVAPLASAHMVPDRASSDGLAAGNLTVESVLSASFQAGGTRTTGTLDAGRWSAEPNDRLIVRSNGRTFTIVVTAMNGDFTSANAFFNGTHQLEASVTTDGEEVTVRSQRNGAARSASVHGTLLFEDVAYNFDLASNGTERFESDSTGTEYHEEHRLLGTVDFGGAHLAVDEGWVFDLISTTGEGRATVTNAVRTIASRLESEGHRYEWSNVRTKKAFRDGQPSEVDSYWGATGQVLRDGATFGEYRLEADLVTREAGFLKFLLALPTETIEVESWKVY